MAIIVVTQPGTIVAVSNGDTVRIDIPGGGDVTLVSGAGNVRRFRVEFRDDAEADTLTIDTSTFTRNDLFIDVKQYDPSDRVILDGATNKQINPDRLDEFIFEFAGPGGPVKSGRIRLKDVGERDFTTAPPPIVICFADGTVIDTELGQMPVEAVRVGDLVRTLDRGPQPVRWVGARTLDSLELARMPHLRPVRIAAGALGGGLPWKDLVVSPQHRIRLADWRAELLFGEREVLIPARALIDGRGVMEADVAAVTYRHLLFDAHEIVWSNGVLSESLHPGQVALSALGEAAAADVQIVTAAAHARLARPSLRVQEARAAAGFVAA